MDDLRWTKDRDLDNLISEQRRAIIFDVVRQRRLAGVQELSDLTGTSVSTVLAKSRSIKLQVMGGTLRPGSYTLLGEPGINFLAGLHVDICLFVNPRNSCRPAFNYRQTV
jgi:DeoR/GlpR family transcriptional regulator of sugar metabolism